jgi:hypothetical protein
MRHTRVWERESSHRSTNSMIANKHGNRRLAGPQRPHRAIQGRAHGRTNKETCHYDYGEHAAKLKRCELIPDTDAIFGVLSQPIFLKETWSWSRACSWYDIKHVLEGVSRF